MKNGVGPVKSIVMKGVILDGYALNPGDLSYDCFSSIIPFEIYDSTDPADVLARCKDADVVITNKVPFDKATMEALPELKYIGVTATGYNIIDIEAARERGIAVTNIPSYSTDAVAQHVFALLLAVSNAVEKHNESVKRGEWERSSSFCYWLTPLFELSGKTLGIIGLGNIGKKVATIAIAFGMRVIAYSPHSRMNGVEAVTLDELLLSSDVLSLNCPLNEKTEKIINEESIEKMKIGSILINASRGALVDEDAVIRALDSGRLSWYCADVLSLEPPRENRLSMHEKSVITPHIAWAPIETRQRLLSIAISNLESFLSGKNENRVV